MSKFLGLGKFSDGWIYKLNFGLYLLFVQIIGNDLLFFGDSSYKQELVSCSQLVLSELLDAIEQESSQVKLLPLV